MQKILVIGGFGFLGRFISNELIARNYEVTVCDIKPDAPEFDARIKVVRHNFAESNETDSVGFLKNFEAIIFCGGRDDRSMPDRDAWEYFYNANVKSCVQLSKLASEAGVSKMIIMGSYFAYFNRAMPELKLAERHHYIRSRVEQTRQSIEAATGKLQVITLEIPYVFGTLQGVTPLWKSLVKYINSSYFVFYTTGGTAFISVNNLAQAACGAVEHAVHKDCIAVAGSNMTWKEMIALIGKSLGKKRAVISIPWWIIQPLTIFMKWHFKVKGIQSGLDPYHFIRVQSINTFLDVDYASKYLHYTPDDLEPVFNETVKECIK